ncbi:hypothetical protein [Pseudomonas sp. RIT411]|uniref:hypothetical protein n=1 Tax=Pseudomonas sp. RIT411 TaxID=2202160 RepID=UPI000D3951E3|nr:hypothetical protein [Pseudomonas sp. RIT 411]RAU40178.1 hypothetical protein DBY63_010300 [Pseudomonas sp. RIT 411]
MLLIAITAVFAYSLVIARCIWFAANGNRFRQDDRTEVMFIVTASTLYVLAHLALWLMEPWKLASNSPASSLIVAHTIFCGGYFFRRIGALVDGRDRRQVQRRVRRAHG